MSVVGRDREGRTVTAGIYEAAVSIQDDETSPFSCPLMQLFIFTYRRNAALCFTDLCLLLQSKISCSLCCGLKGTCKLWLVQL